MTGPDIAIISTADRTARATRVRLAGSGDVWPYDGDVAVLDRHLGDRGRSFLQLVDAHGRVSQRLEVPTWTSDDGVRLPDGSILVVESSGHEFRIASHVMRVRAVVSRAAEL